MVDRTPALDEVRRWFAEDLRAICHLRDESAGARSEADEAALGRALDARPGQPDLRRDPHDADDSCWLHGDGWCLSGHELH